MRKFILFSIFTSICFLQSKAQDIPQKVQRSKWVQIMSNDSAYNYFEAREEFKKYYTQFLKEKKKEEAKLERKKSSSSEEEHLENPTELLVADYLRWSIAIKPFVKSDGTIMPLTSRLEIINSAKKKSIAEY